MTRLSYLLTILLLYTAHVFPQDEPRSQAEIEQKVDSILSKMTCASP